MTYDGTRKPTPPPTHGSRRRRRQWRWTAAQSKCPTCAAPRRGPWMARRATCGPTPNATTERLARIEEAIERIARQGDGAVAGREMPGGGALSGGVLVPTCALPKHTSVPTTITHTDGPVVVVDAHGNVLQAPRRMNGYGWKNSLHRPARSPLTAATRAGQRRYHPSMNWHEVSVPTVCRFIVLGARFFKTQERQGRRVAGWFIAGLKRRGDRLPPSAGFVLGFD